MQRVTTLLAAAGALAVLAAAVPAQARGWDHGGWHGHAWHHGWHGPHGWHGGYVSGPPAYYPPPVYYAPAYPAPAYVAPPSVWFSTPGLSVGIN